MTDKSAREVISNTRYGHAVDPDHGPYFKIIGPEKADAILAALEAAGLEQRKRPVTLRDWLTIRDEATAHIAQIALGDQTECVSLAASKEQK